MRTKMRNLLFPALLLCALLSPARGQTPDKEGFVPESRPADMSRPKVDEGIPAAPLVAGAYGFIWVAVLVYVGTVATRARRLSAEIAVLSRRLDGGAAG